MHQLTLSMEAPGPKKLAQLDRRHGDGPSSSEEQQMGAHQATQELTEHGNISVHLGNRGVGSEPPDCSYREFLTFTD